jgi:cytochrome c oxidase cbb3-type subunit 3
MSDFTSDFWNVYIAALTIVSIVGCGWLLLSQSRAKVRKGGTGADTTGHVWDGDLTEYNNPLPRWWSILFWITIVFSFVYLVLYPGLGSFRGVLGWTQAGQYAKETSEAEARIGPLYARYASMPIADVAADAEARAMGERIFLNNCAQCHGSDAGGARGFPNLRDSDWLYGGAPETIEKSILDGRNGVMPPLGAALGDDGVKNVVAYVRSLSKLTSDPLRAQIGREKFAQVCAACHGADGKGNPALGAPNLTDAVWLYGSSEAQIAATVTQGRGAPSLAEGTSAMPAHRDKLGEARVHLVAAYVWSLSNSRPPAK